MPVSAPISAEQVAKLREKTGAGFMDCKKALAETNGDFEKAVEVLRKKGLASAAQRAGRTAADGLVGTYVHHSGKVGVMLELNCETDFVAKSTDFQELTKELALQIAAANPRWLRREDVPVAILEKEKEIYRQQAAATGKPAAALDKIVEGKLNKFYSDFCLLEQLSVRDSSGKTKVGDLIARVIAKVGENVVLKRFARFQVGEETASTSSTTNSA
ncbi:MAG: translation elongation factor Ts [Elusimicrobia bacterium]|nr:translation elongation factor Ts [Elusimicrobiota bacterium]